MVNYFKLQLLLEINKLKTEKDDLSSKITELKEQIASQPTPNGTTSPDKVINFFNLMLYFLLYKILIISLYVLCRMKLLT